MGFSKGTLFYLKKNARDGEPFTMNKHVRERLEQWCEGSLSDDKDQIRMHLSS
jgi:hypothetical protein